MIYTFYSYKGGVGRSMALANVAQWYYSHGLNVVIVDWDLEAPGLESFFLDDRKQLEELRGHVGIVDMLSAYKRMFAGLSVSSLTAPSPTSSGGSSAAMVAGHASFREVLQSALPGLEAFLYPLGQSRKSGSSLQLLTAGLRAGDSFESYGRQIQGFDWAEFYDAYQGQVYFDWLGDELRRVADIVLIDSRTGVTEMGGVCARQLADVVVSFVAPNFQNLAGVRAMVSSFTRKDVLDVRQRALQSVIVPARLDGRSDTDLQNEFEREFKTVLDERPNVFKALQRTSWDLKIPYISKYAYKEKLAVGQADRSEDLEKAYTELALYLATLAPDGSAIRTQLATDLRNRFPDLLPSVFVTFRLSEGAELCARLQQQLAKDNITVSRMDDVGARGGPVLEELARLFDHTRHMIVAATPAVFTSPYVQAEVQIARARGIPVYVVASTANPVAPDALPPWLQGQTIFDVDQDIDRLRRLLQTTSLTVRVPYMVPDLLATFVPRRALQHDLRTLLLDSAPLDVNIALAGPPGIGKSVLATALAHDDEVVSRFRGGIIWLNLQPAGDARQSAERATAEVERAWEALTGEKPVAQSELETASRLAQLAAERSCLVVIDNATMSGVVESLLASDRPYSRLMTTRDVRLCRTARATVVPVPSLTTDEARQLVLSGVTEPAAEANAIGTVMKRFDNHPLVMTWVNAELRSYPNQALIADLKPRVDDLIDEHRGELSMILGPALNELTPFNQERYRALSLLTHEEIALLSRVVTLFPDAQPEPVALPEQILNRLRVADVRELVAVLDEFRSRSLVGQEKSGLFTIPTLVRLFFSVSIRPNESSAPVQAQLVERAQDLLRGRAAPVSDHLALAKQLKAVKQFTYARRLLALARTHEGFARESDQVRRTIVQQLALCTYKDDDLPVEERLTRALEVLTSLGELSTTTDQETLGIAGGIFKRRWEQDGNRAALERSLACYQRGYEIGHPDDPSYDLGYTGINAAFVLDLLGVEEERAARDVGGSAGFGESRHARADRTRRDLLETLRGLIARPGHAHLLTNWWLLVTLGEAAFGLDEYREATRWLNQAAALPGVADWEFETTARQLARIAHLRAKGDVPGGEALDVLRGFLKGSADAVLGALEGKVGLALSGGGFRASLFHIGVLARLADADLLRRVEVMSCVSGGSIIGAHYYLEVKRLLEERPDQEITRDHFIEIVQRIEREFLLGVQTNIRMQMFADPVAALRTAFTGVYSRSERVGELYEKHLFSRADDGAKGPRYISDLFIRPKGARETFSPKLHNWGRSVKVPMLVINAATLNTGHAWQFTASWMGEPPGSIETAIDTNDRLRRMYYSEAPARYRRVRLGLAVASSSCVPGLFDPVVLDGLFPGRTIRLVDGGVCDNQGVAALLEQDCSLLIVSDASGQMTSEANPSAGTLGSVLRSSGISQERVRLAQYQDLLARKRLSRVRDLLFVHLRKDLDSEPVDWIGSQDPLVEVAPRRTTLTSYGIRKDIQAQLAGLRTDLDSFSDIEAYALMTSGYRMVDTELRGALAHLPVALSPPTPWRFLQIEKDLRAQDVDRIRKVLDVGKFLFLKPWALVPGLRYVTIFVAIAVAVLAGMLMLKAFGASAISGVPAIALVPLAAFAIVLIGLGLSAFRRPAAVTVRIIKSAFLLAFALVARVYLWVFDRLFLKVGGLRPGPEPRQP